MAKGLALVSGASSGIGFELAELFAGDGYDLVVAADEDSIESCADKLRGAGVDVRAVQVDLRKPEDVDRLYNIAIEDGRTLQAAALNAGSGRAGPFIDGDMDDDLGIIDLNVRSTVQLAKLVLVDMARQGSGKVLFTSSHRRWNAGLESEHVQRVKIIRPVLRRGATRRVTRHRRHRHVVDAGPHRHGLLPPGRHVGHPAGADAERRPGSRCTTGVRSADEWRPQGARCLTVFQSHGGDELVAARRGEVGSQPVDRHPHRKSSKGIRMTQPAAVESSLTVERDIAATRQQVWNVIADGWTYSQWVVGNTRMRAVDPRWPAPGAVIHHTIGIWPVVLNDETEVESSTPLEELILLAKGRPFGGARITLRLSDSGAGCRVEMAEVPVGGPLNWVPRRLALAAAYPRNRECLARLAALAERREEPK